MANQLYTSFLVDTFLASCLLLIALPFCILATFVALLVAILLRLLPAKDSKRALVGFHEIGRNVYSYAQSLKRLGYDTHSLIIKADPHHGTVGYTKVLLKTTHWTLYRKVYVLVYLLMLLPYVLLRYQTIVIVWYITFLPLGLDLLLLRLARKKIIYVSCGSEVRYCPIQWKIDRALLGDVPWTRTIPKGSNLEFTRKLWRQIVLKMSLASVVTYRSAATFQIMPAYQFFFAKEQSVDRAIAAREKKRVLVVHAPTARMMKSTSLVLEAIEIAQNTCDFSFEVIENRPNSYVIERLIEADILIDQACTILSRLAVEGLSCGAIVIANYPRHYNGSTLMPPIVDFPNSADHLAKTLCSLIQNPESMQELKTQSYEFWENHCTPKNFDRLLQGILDGEPANLLPFPDQKKLLSQFAENFYQKILIKLIFRKQFNSE